jgi:hypothetical protein
MQTAHRAPAGSASHQLARHLAAPYVSEATAAAITRAILAQWWPPHYGRRWDDPRDPDRLTRAALDAADADRHAWPTRWTPAPYAPADEPEDAAAEDAPRTPAEARARLSEIGAQAVSYSTGDVGLHATGAAGLAEIARTTQALADASGEPVSAETLDADGHTVPLATSSPRGTERRGKCAQTLFVDAPPAHRGPRHEQTRMF